MGKHTSRIKLIPNNSYKAFAVQVTVASEMRSGGEEVGSVRIAMKKKSNDVHSHSIIQPVARGFWRLNKAALHNTSACQCTNILLSSSICLHKSHTSRQRKRCRQIILGTYFHCHPSLSMMQEIHEEHIFREQDP
eukprot:6193742-Pleurochrysis_carterae.AAC.2